MNLFISYPEMQLILCKGNASREENEMNLFISYPEMQLILCKGSYFFEINDIYANFALKSFLYVSKGLYSEATS